MKLSTQENIDYGFLKKPISLDFKDYKTFTPNSNEDESTEVKNIDKEIKYNVSSDFYSNNNNIIISPKVNKDISSKINITINNDDILQEQKLLKSKFLNLLLTEKKAIFSCKKREHDPDDNILIPPISRRRRMQRLGR